MSLSPTINSNVRCNIITVDQGREISVEHVNKHVKMGPWPLEPGGSSHKHRYYPCNFKKQT